MGNWWYLAKRMLMLAESPKLISTCLFFSLSSCPTFSHSCWSTVFIVVKVRRKIKVPQRLFENFIWEKLMWGNVSVWFLELVVHAGTEICFPKYHNKNLVLLSVDCILLNYETVCFLLHLVQPQAAQGIFIAGWSHHQNCVWFSVLMTAVRNCSSSLFSTSECLYVFCRKRNDIWALLQS